MTLSLRWLDSDAGHLGVAVATAAAANGRGVLIVPSIGHEANQMKAGTIDLARHLAACGVDALVLQLAATDQSYGTTDMADVVGHWHASIRRGVEELHEMGVIRPLVVACGVGASLLAHAVDPHRLGGVALWSPITSGRRWVRELRLLSAASAGGLVSDGELNVAGFRFNADLIAGVSRLKLTATDLVGVSRVLVVDHQRRECEVSLIDELRRAGTSVTHARVDDLVDWLNVDEPVSPTQSITRISDWALDTEPTVSTPDWPTPARRSTAVQTLGTPDEIEEEFVTFGHPRLTGVFHQGIDDGRAALMIASSSGPGRHFVTLARAESAAGRTVLRFDFAGSGWSDPPLDSSNTFAYDARAVDDVRAAVAWLRTQSSAPIVAVGFCAGARALIDAAATVDMDSVVAINVELFEPMRTAPPTRRLRSPQRGVRQSVREVFNVVGDRRRSKLALKQFVRSGVRLRLIFDQSEIAARYLQTFGIGRSALSGEHHLVSVLTLPRFGHNFDGPDADQALTDVSKLLAEHDEMMSQPAPSKPTLARRLGVVVAMATLNFAGGALLHGAADAELQSEAFAGAETKARSRDAAGRQTRSSRRSVQPPSSGHRRGAAACAGARHGSQPWRSMSLRRLRSSTTRGGF